MPSGGGGSGVVLPVAIAQGGTGSTSAAAALAALGGVGSHVLKRGTGGGSHTTTSSTYAAIDTTNLDVTLSVPTGMLAVALFFCTGGASGGALETAIAVDGTVSSNAFVGAASVPSGSSIPCPAPPVVLAGNGNSHTFSPRFASSNNSSTVTVIDDNALDAPVHLVLLIPAT
jgi:hypothetical protein